MVHFYTCRFFSRNNLIICQISLICNCFPDTSSIMQGNFHHLWKIFVCFWNFLLNLAIKLDDVLETMIRWFRVLSFFLFQKWEDLSVSYTTKWNLNKNFYLLLEKKKRGKRIELFFFENGKEYPPKCSLVTNLIRIYYCY